MSHDDVRQLAGKLTGAGFHVFPTLHKKGDPNDKRPAHGHNGFHDATSDLDQFEKLLRAVRIGPGWHLGLGVHPGSSGHIVFDVDVTDGGQGLKSLAWIESVHGPLPGRRVRTPSSGLHIWMRLPDGYDGEIGNKKAWPDVDIRCHKGYVIAAGVFVPWGAWTPESGEISEIPAVVLAEIEAARTEPKQIPDEATPGDRHETLVSLAASMWGKGLDKAAVLAAIRGYNAEQCKPPKPDSELVDIVEWTVTKEGGPPPAVILPGATGGQPLEPVAGIFLDWSDFWKKDRDAAEWLKENVLARGRGHAAYAPAGTKKSLFTLWVAAGLTTGREPVAGIYLDYEMTEDDLYERLEDMGYGPDTDLSRFHYALLPNLPPLDTREGGQAIEQILNQVEAAHPDHHLFVVIDTTGRAVEGEENSADTLRKFYSHTGIILKRRGVTWIRLDHTGKDIAKGQRGTKAKDDDPDVVWLLRETDNGVMLVAKKRRMGWVPDRATFTQLDNPLRFLPVAGDWPKGTREIVELLDRLAVPVGASTRAAQAALKEAGEGRRREAIIAALKWRVEAGNHPGNHLVMPTREPPREPPTEKSTTTRAEPLPEPPGTTPPTSREPVPLSYREPGSRVHEEEAQICPECGIGSGRHGADCSRYDLETEGIAP